METDEHQDLVIAHETALSTHQTLATPIPYSHQAINSFFRGRDQCSYGGDMGSDDHSFQVRVPQSNAVEYDWEPDKRDGDTSGRAPKNLRMALSIKNAHQ